MLLHNYKIIGWLRLSTVLSFSLLLLHLAKPALAAVPILPAITSPTDGTTLTSSTVSFNWDYGNQLVDNAELSIGTSQDKDDIFPSSLLNLTDSSITLTNLPSDGSTLYVRFAYVVNGQDWQSIYYTYKAAGFTTCDTNIDSDNDRLADCYETNTKHYISAQDTGTDPNNADTDGDGIQDGDEVLGTTNGLNLPSLGVNPLHKDILVEYDWMQDATPFSTPCHFHSHRPTTDMINLIKSTFDNAPVSNPDGKAGINIIQDYGQGGVFNGGNLINDADGRINGNTNGNDYKTYKAMNFEAERNGYFHYILLTHQFGSATEYSTGWADMNGANVIVATLCGIVDYDQQTTANTKAAAFTIMHELGHNLGLSHGGDINTNFKPNYNSIMNYRFQFKGVDSENSCDSQPDGIGNFSLGKRLTLNEHNLDEYRGICGNKAIDFDNNGIISNGVVADINNNDGFYEILSDYNDWANLNFMSVNNPNVSILEGLQTGISCQIAPSMLNH